MNHALNFNLLQLLRILFLLLILFSFKAILCNSVKKESELFVCTVLNLITDLYQDIGTIHKDDLQNLLDWYSGVDKKELKCRESLLVSVVPVQAILIKHSIETGSDNNRYFHDTYNLSCSSWIDILIVFCVLSPYTGTFFG
jgi:hypothetical protein